MKNWENMDAVKRKCRSKDKESNEGERTGSNRILKIGERERQQGRKKLDSLTEILWKQLNPGIVGIQKYDHNLNPK